eukprot:758640-Hanusia_phi.AAC.2
MCLSLEIDGQRQVRRQTCIAAFQPSRARLPAGSIFRPKSPEFVPKVELWGDGESQGKKHFNGTVQPHCQVMLRGWDVMGFLSCVLSDA